MHDGLIRLVLWLVARGLFRPQLRGQENVPTRGPALVASNHLTYVDGFLIWYFISCPVRFIVWKPFFRVPLIAWGLRYIEAIPVADGGTRNMRETMRHARKQLTDGNVVCIFPEGSITRTGELQPFRRGMELMVSGLDVPIIPIHLDGLWGSIFSFEGGRAFLKWPKRLRHPATVTFGRPMPAHSSAEEVRNAIIQLGEEVARAAGMSGTPCAPLRDTSGGKTNHSRSAGSGQGGAAEI
jgi:acyl-[acyl-carrier-protein]-phospholipid O-acyltransferase / long-chain-fatty-acid--[acyl-carrier-protein] ligase